jgi:hypothetical protein
VVAISISGFYLALRFAPSLRHAARSGFFFGYGFFIAGTYWISYSLLVDAKSFGWMVPFAIFGLNAVLAIYFVLLAVIALAAVASLAVGVGAIAAQTQAISVRAAVNQAQMRATFDAALTTAIYQMLTSDAPSLSPDGRLSRWTMAEATIDLRIVAEAGRLDLNQAPAAQFEALARALGANATSAQRLAKHYSSARGTVRDPVESRAWPGMSASLFEAMAPYLTAHGETAARADLSPGALLAARAPLDVTAIRAARAEGLPVRAERLTNPLENNHVRFHTTHLGRNKATALAAGRRLRPSGAGPHRPAPSPVLKRLRPQ